MAGTKDGFERVDIRSVWPNEALDFTPWLAEESASAGGRQSGMKLELVQTEKIVRLFVP